MKILNQQQLERYKNDGFLVLERFAAPETCAKLRQRANTLVENFDPADSISIFTTNEQTRHSDDYFLESGDKIRFFFEEEAFTPEGKLRQAKSLSINKIGHALHDLDPFFNDFSRQKKLANLAEDIGFRNPLLAQSMYIFKQPNIGGEVNCHQDSTFLYTDPPSVTGFWFALQDATLENGCLWAIPGKHQTELKSRFVRKGEGTAFNEFDSEAFLLDGAVPLEVPEGTLIVLHGLLPHYSAVNRSSKSRQAYTLHIIEGAYDYPVDNWLQRPEDNPFKGF